MANSMKIKILLLSLFLLFFINSCFLLNISELFLKSSEKEKITREEAQHRLDLYWAITIKDVDKVREYMDKGYDPNKSMGEEGWSDSTPLNVVANCSYDNFNNFKRGEKVLEQSYGVAMLQLLVEAGADVNQRPYIWYRIYSYDNFLLNYRLENKILLRTWETPKTKEEEEELKIENEEAALYYVLDQNCLIEAFLKAGADPDKLGHPYPYSLEAKRKKITDEQAEKYFAKGTRPINEAIKKGMWWESQVDLLLQYTTLDKDSLKAAKESKDKAMIEKITKLWNEQNGGK